MSIGIKQNFLIFVISLLGTALAYLCYPKIYNFNPIIEPTFLGFIFCFITGYFLFKRAPSVKFYWEIKYNHWVQLIGQIGFFIAWSYYYDQVYLRLPLYIGQIFLAVYLQILIDIYLKRDVRLGISLIPVVFSINFFLWFNVHYYWASLLMIAVAIVFKNFVLVKTKHGKQHLFNPSVAPMAIATYIILVLHYFNLNHGIYMDAPARMYPIQYAGLILVLVSFLPQYFSRTHMITVGAFISHIVITCFFGFSHFIETSTFLAISLLITDPITSPKNYIVQIFYGGLYYFSVRYTENRLIPFGIEPFFAKVIALPILNIAAVYLNNIYFDNFNFLKKRYYVNIIIYIIFSLFMLRFIRSPYFEAIQIKLIDFYG